MDILYPMRVDRYTPVSTIIREVGKRLPYSVTAFGNEPPSDIDVGDINAIPVGEGKRDKALSYFRTTVLSSDYDILHSGPVKPNVVAAISQIHSSTNHVHTIHNCEWGFSKGIYSTFHRHFLTQICDKLTVPSPYTASIASSHIWGEKKPVVIPNGVDIDRFKPDNSESISKRVLYIGRIANRKHPEMVVDLAQQMSEYTFHARIKNIEKRPDLYERVKDEPNVKLLGQLSISEIAEEYARASVLLAPYEREAFGMAVLESLASNTKVIGLSSGNLECLLDHEGGRLLNTLSTDDWKRAIQEIESESVDHTARNIAVEYSWDNISKEYKKLYDSLVHG